MLLVLIAFMQLFAKESKRFIIWGESLSGSIIGIY